MSTKIAIGIAAGVARTTEEFTPPVLETAHSCALISSPLGAASVKKAVFANKTAKIGLYYALGKLVCVLA